MKRVLFFIALLLIALFVRAIRFELLSPLGNSTEILDKDGQLLRITLSSDQKFRLHTPFYELSPAIIHATLEKEDKYFFFHPGINPIALVRATLSHLLGRNGGGASTITMQLARLRFDLSTRTFWGKLRQIVYALILERDFTKQEILEAYLNLAPYGRNIEGIGAASLLYYNTEAKKITTPQALKLVEIPQSPTRRVKTYFPLVRLLPFEAPHFVEKILRHVEPGSIVKTTLNLSLQQNTENLFHQFIERMKEKGVKNGSILIADQTDLSVRAYVGSSDYFDTSIAGQVNGAEAKRSPGSSLKPFIYALAAQQGLIHSETVLVDSNFNKSNYNPENFEKNFIGPISATDALIHSRNIPAIYLLNQLKPETFRKFLLDAGVSKVRDADFYGLSLALGGVEVSLEELVTLYGILADGGVKKSLRFFPTAEDTGRKLLSPESTYMILKMLAGNPRPESMAKFASGAPISWKTGTSFGFRDAWATAVVGNSIISVWLGNFDGSGNPIFVGRELAGELLFTLIDGLNLNQYGDNAWYLHKPDKVNDVTVCATSGDLPETFCPHTKKSIFIAGVSSAKHCSVHREVAVDGVKKVVEIWPSDVLKIFAEGGLPRTEVSGTNEFHGNPPLITSPQESLTYVLTEQNKAIPFTAVIDGDSAYEFWSVDGLPVAKINRDETFFWEACPGVHIISVIDQKGRNNEVKIKVE